MQQMLSRVHPQPKLEYEWLEGPPPPVEAGRKSSEAHLIFDLLEPGRGVEFNRKPEALRQLAVRYAKSRGIEARFTVRKSTKPGWSRIWRVA